MEGRRLKTPVKLLRSLAGQIFSGKKEKPRMKITGIRAIPLSDPIPEERQHRTDLGTKVKSDSVLVLIETD